MNGTEYKSCCRCCEAAAERGELDHKVGNNCPHPPCDYCQPAQFERWMQGRVQSTEDDGPGQWVPDMSEHPAYDHGMSFCPACGDRIDYCQGHGPIGDRQGWIRLRQHDFGIHLNCHPRGCEDAGTITERRS